MSAGRPLEDPSVYPRVYRASGGWLIALILCGIVLAIGGAIGAWFSATAAVSSTSSRLWIVALCLVFVVFGIYCVLSTLRSRVVLFADRIEVEELTRTSVLKRDEVLGWRSLPTSPPDYIFVPKDASRRSVKIAQVFPLDSEFAQWLYTLPSLDGEEARESKAEIRNNVRLGATPGERMKKLARGKRLARLFSGIGMFAVFWGFIYPRPYELVVVILAALPWIAIEIVRRSGGLFRIDTTRNDPHPNVAVPFIFPGMVLALRSTVDYNVLQSLSVAWLFVGLGGFLCFAAYKVDPTRGRNIGTLIIMFAFSVAYGYGLVIETNVLLDHSHETRYTANVQGKHIVSGKTTSYELDLGPWGPETKPNGLRVRRETFNAVQSGDIVF